MHKLDHKFNALCINSKWKYSERLNLSPTKLEALSFCLKLASGIHKAALVDTVVKTDGDNDTEFDNVFIQGIITDTLETNNERCLPQRHLNALSHLTKYKEIHITSSDNGDRIVNVNRRTNNDNINLLQNLILIPCVKIDEHKIITQPQQFNNANCKSN